MELARLVFWAVMIGALMFLVSKATQEFQSSASNIF